MTRPGWSKRRIARHLRLTLAEVFLAAVYGFRLAP